MESSLSLTIHVAVHLQNAAKHHLDPDHPKKHARGMGGDTDGRILVEKMTVMATALRSRRCETHPRMNFDRGRDPPVLRSDLPVGAGTIKTEQVHTEIETHIVHNAIEAENGAIVERDLVLALEAVMTND